jgi:hypothetical protein
MEQRAGGAGALQKNLFEAKNATIFEKISPHSHALNPVLLVEMTA